MLTPSLPRLRPERLIAAGRVVLSAFSLLAVWLDPTEPAQFADFTYVLLSVYLAYAIGVAIVVWRSDVLPPRWPVATHVVDLGLFTLVIFLTAGPGSPLNGYFVFAMMCATLRWQARGTIATAVYALTVFSALGAYFAMAPPTGDFDERSFVLRGGYLLVIAVFLVYIGIHEQRLLREMWLLTSWPHDRHDDVSSVVPRVLSFAQPLVAVDGVGFAWLRRAAPIGQLAIVTGTTCELESIPPESMVHADLERTAFICNGPERRTLIQREPRSLVLADWDGDPISGSLAARIPGASSMIVVPVSGETADGHLVLFDRRDFSTDDLVIAEIVGKLIMGHIDACYIEDQIHDVATSEERIRLSRDLHDGVLQSFTGIALKLAVIRRLLASGDVRVASEIDRLQQVIGAEQRELRFYIQDLGPSGAADVALSERLAELIVRFEREWDLAVTLDLGVDDAVVCARSRDIYHIVRESLVNAARHGLASHATVTIGLSRTHGLQLSIVDDGRGFSFAGRFTSEELAQLNIGPKTLRERVEALNGSMTISSGHDGAAVHIELPLAAA